MKAFYRASPLGLLFGLACGACSAGMPQDAGSTDSAEVDEATSVQQALPCSDENPRRCDSRPPKWPCKPLCADRSCGAADGCGGLCSSGWCGEGTVCGGAGAPNQCACQPTCVGKTCGAADGCGGICASGTCPPGGVCGGVAAGSCAFPDLQPTVSGSITSYHHATFNVRIWNVSQVGVSNVELLLQTNLPALVSSLTTTNGFVCHTLSAYAPRIGMTCEAGAYPGFGYADLKIELAFTQPGFNVLSVFADPNNAITEVAEVNNMANAGVNIP